MEDKVALFDMDGTLADYEGQLLKDLAALRSPGEPDIHPYHDDQNTPVWLENRMKLIKNSKGWWERLSPMPDGFQIFNHAKAMGFDLAVLTKGPRTTHNAWSEKLIWCQAYLGEDIDVTITFKKARVYGRLLVDDFPEYIKSWLDRRPRGRVIMPTRRCNIGFEYPQVVRFGGGEEDWKRVVEAMEFAYNR
jgi:hypothetical protein